MRYEGASSAIIGIQFRSFDLIFFVGCFVFLYLHLFLVPNTPIFYEMDHVALLNDAKRMYEGEIIYRDFFEFTFPGSHLLYYIFLNVFGTNYWIANLLILVHGMAAVILCVAICRRIIGDNFYAYLPAALYVFFGFRWFGIDGEHRMFSPILAYVAVFFLISKTTYVRLAVAGIACALSSLFTQQRGVLAIGAIGVFLFIKIALKEKDWPRFMKSGLVLAFTFAASLLLMLLPFIITAGPDRFYESTFLFLSNYVEDPSTNSFATYLGTLAKIRSFGLLMTVVAVFYYILIPLIYVITLVFIWTKRKNPLVRHKDGVLLVCLLGMFFAIGTFAPNAVRIFQISLPALILLGWLIAQINFKSDLPAKAAVLILITFGLTMSLRLQTGWDVHKLSTPSGELAFLSPVVFERYLWLSEHAGSEDLVYETYNSHVNFPLHLRNPSRISIILNTAYTPRSQVDQAIADLKTTKARYIIWDGSWTEEIGLLSDEQKLKPFYLFLTSNYHLRQKFTPYDARQREIWEIIDNRP